MYTASIKQTKTVLLLFQGKDDQGSKYPLARLPGASKNSVGQVEILTSLPDGQVVDLGKNDHFKISFFFIKTKLKSPALFAAFTSYLQCPYTEPKSSAQDCGNYMNGFLVRYRVSVPHTKHKQVSRWPHTMH